MTRITDNNGIETCHAVILSLRDQMRAQFAAYHEQLHAQHELSRAQQEQLRVKNEELATAHAE